MQSAERKSRRRGAGTTGLDATPDGAPRLGLLGGFELRAGGRTVVPPPHGQRLLAFLALQGRPLHRAYVSGRLWIELTQDHAHACLRTALWRLGRLSAGILVVTATHVGLAPEVRVDARVLEEAAERVLAAGGPPTLDDLVELEHEAELLPGWYDDWVAQERDRLRQLRLLALESAGTRLVAEGRHAEAALAALAAIDADPLRESAYRLLIAAYLGDGNAAEALHQYAVFSAHLRRDLGLEPSAQMTELVRGLA